jgi:hypothetical protein
MTHEEYLQEQRTQQAQAAHERRVNADLEGHRQAKVEQALRERPPGHQWRKDIPEAEAHLAEVSEVSRAAACEREIAKAQAEGNEIKAHRTGLGKERAGLEAAIAVGEHTDADAERLTELCELLGAGGQGEGYVLVGPMKGMPVEVDTPELKRLKDKIAALRERRRAAISDYIPLYQDRIAADYNVKSLVTVNLQDKLAGLQQEVNKAEADLVSVRSKTINAQRMRPGADPDSMGNRGIEQIATEEAASKEN